MRSVNFNDIPAITRFCLMRMAVALQRKLDAPTPLSVVWPSYGDFLIPKACEGWQDTDYSL